MNWLNQNSGAIQAIATVVLVAITGWYVFLTHKLAVAADNQYQLQRRSELLGQKQEILHVAELAADLLENAEDMLNRPLPELLTLMRSEKWQEKRDELELSGIAAGGVVQRQASLAAQSLRDWAELMKPSSGTDAERNRAVAQANEHLRAAVDCLRKLKAQGQE